MTIGQDWDNGRVSPVYERMLKKKMPLTVSPPVNDSTIAIHSAVLLVNFSRDPGQTPSFYGLLSLL